MSSNYTTFWRLTDPNPEFSQWYISYFIFDLDLPDKITSLRIFEDEEVINNLNDKRFNCAEQFMMTVKAYLFNDYIVADKILKEKKPSRQKSLGRTITNFSDEIWNIYSSDIVTLGNYLKFSQNNELKMLLLNTGESIIVEGSPYDNIWGAGLRFDDNKIYDQSQWLGQNKLGECLMDVREYLKSAITTST